MKTKRQHLIAFVCWLASHLLPYAALCAVSLAYCAVLAGVLSLLDRITR